MIKKATILIICLSAMMFIPIFQYCDGQSTESQSLQLSYLFPSKNLTSEDTRYELADHILKSLKFYDYELNSSWIRKDEVLYGLEGYTSHQFNFTDNCTLVLYYSNNNFARLELDSEWGSGNNITKNMMALSSIIGIEQNSNLSYEYQRLPYWSPKGEIRGYYNTSSSSDSKGFTNSNRIFYHERPKGEFLKTEVIIDAWYNSIGSGNEKEIYIEKFRALINETDPKYKDIIFASGFISCQDNKTTLDYTTSTEIIRIDLYYQHTDPNQLLMVSGDYDIYKDEIVSWNENTIANSSLYWPSISKPEPTQPEGVNDFFNNIARYILPISIIIFITILLSLLTISFLAKRNSKDIFDTLSRKKIYELVQKSPGIHFRKIMRELDMKQGVVSFHVNILEDEGYIRSVQNGVFRCFFASDTKSELKLKLNKAQQIILFEVYSNPGLSITELSKKLSRTKTLIYYHTSILDDAGLILKKKNGRITSFYITGDGERYIS